MLISENATCEICKKGFTPEEQKEYYSMQGKDYHKHCYEYEQREKVNATLLSLNRIPALS